MNTRKRIVSLLVALALMLSLCPAWNHTAVAASNTSMAAATKITSGQQVNVTVFPGETLYYSVTTTGYRQFLQVNTTDIDLDISLMDSRGEHLVYSGGRSSFLSVAWDPGVYYLAVNSLPNSSVTASFTLTVTENDSNEPNDSMNVAVPVAVGQRVEFVAPGWTSLDEDWFQITVTEPGQIIALTPESDAVYCSFYDASGKRVNSYGYVDSPAQYAVAHSAGTYYISVEYYSNDHTTVTAGAFTVQLLDNDAYEDNNTAVTAAPIASGDTKDLILGCGDYDWFKITTTKPGQIISASVQASESVSTDIYKADGTTNLYWRSGEDYTAFAVAPEIGTYYIRCSASQNIGLQSAELSVQLLDNDAYEYNNTAVTAAPIASGDTKDLILGCGDYDWFKITTTKPGQIISASVQASESVSTDFYKADGTTSLDWYSGTNYGPTAITGEAGIYYIRCSKNNDTGITNAALTVKLLDNDAYEPNGTKETAYTLTSGEPAEVMLIGGDRDWFVVETTRPGQDIRLDISGFNYANVGSVSVQYDELDSAYISANRTFYYHASQPGSHYITLYNGRCSTADTLNLTLTATVLDGDKHESTGSDTRENAVTLHPGTDETFNMGGRGDEDWFRFEVASGEGSSLYTLQFLGLNPDYSDEFYYEVYAPDGSVVVSRTKVNIYHSAIIACNQQGMYTVRIFTQYLDSWGDPVSLGITRADLRIRVTVGGSDPYENNDTWLEAKPIQPGQLIQHVLSSDSDSDWFYFTAEEADMSFTLTCDSSVSYALYSAADLVDGESSSTIGSGGHAKLSAAGVYYIHFYTGYSSVSQDLRSFTVTLEPHRGEEDNDTWDKAVTIYESVPQTFDIAGSNDVDWFKFTVPAGASRAVVRWTCENGSLRYYLYREEDFEKVGLNAPSVYDGYPYNGEASGWVVTEGTYYIKVRNNSGLPKGCTLTYALTFDQGGSSMEDAIPLQPGVWSDARATTAWYSLGTLQAGDVVRYARDGDGDDPNVYLYRADSSSYITFSTCANDSFSISTAGEYYLKVYAATGLDGNGEPYTTRIRYDIGTGSDKTTALEGSDTLTLTVGEVYFPDLRQAPYTSYSAGGYYIFLDTNSDSSVAGYDKYTGFITAKAPGTTTMRFQVSNGSKTLYKTVTVSVVEEDPVPAVGIAISGAPAELAQGGSARLSAVVTPVEATEKVVWTTSDPSVLYVTPAGKVVAVGEGTAQITAAVAAGSDSVTITVVPAQPTEDAITSMVLDRYELTVYMGENTEQLTATVLPAGIAANIKWVSSNTAAATVDQSGIVTAVAPGISIITASAGDHSVSCIVTVQAARVRVQGIRFTEAEMQIPLGGTTLLTPVIEPYNATVKTLTWVSDDPSVATVSRTGIVNALAVGRTTIRATTLDGGFVAEMTVEVTAAPQLGDINGDGRVNAADAMITLFVAVGKQELNDVEFRAADVTGDNCVDAADAVRILRFDAGFIDSLN